jgi:hypothetical protein
VDLEEVNVEACQLSDKEDKQVEELIQYRWHQTPHDLNPALEVLRREDRELIQYLWLHKMVVLGE